MFLTLRQRVANLDTWDQVKHILFLKNVPSIGIDILQAGRHTLPLEADSPYSWQSVMGRTEVHESALTTNIFRLCIEFVSPAVQEAELSQHSLGHLCPMNN